MADSTSKRIKALRAQIEAQGGRVSHVEHGKHLKVFFTNPQGVKQLLVMAISPSDRRAEQRNQRTLRRLMQQGPELALRLCA